MSSHVRSVFSARPLDSRFNLELNRSDTMTNSYSSLLRSGLSLAQPTGSWTNGFGYDPAKRLTNVTPQAGNFAYAYNVGQASRQFCSAWSVLWRVVGTSATRHSCYGFF